jgi:uncharacterized protein YceK
MRALIAVLIAVAALSGCGSFAGGWITNPLAGNAPVGAGAQAIGALCSEEWECKRAPVLVSLIATQRRATTLLERGGISRAQAIEVEGHAARARDALDRGARDRNDALIQQARVHATRARAALEARPQ